MVVVLVVVCVIGFRARRRKQQLTQVAPASFQGKGSLSRTDVTSSTSSFTAVRPFASESEHERKKRSKAAALLHAWELNEADLILDETIGYGGQAQIFHGRWRGIEVAAKQPRAPRGRQSAAASGSTAASAADSQFDAMVSNMIRREVRALSRVRHPNVVRLYGACFTSTPTVVMAYAANGTLQDAVESHRFQAASEVVRLLAGVARGMQAIHNHGLIHLDLKPENVRSTPMDPPPWSPPMEPPSSL